ncbi:prepilin peptidase [Vibrio makurazakiensis]|uniref:prepilin peptidase n=1 Tax=Vibrio makurazakiensis TaxID=2910250 RepID=UPI003D131A75
MFFLLGASLFSFFQCVLSRAFIEGRKLIDSLVSGSKCDYCGEPLTIKEYFPIVWFYFLKGKSKCCSKKIDTKYILGEWISGGALCLFVFLLFHA